VAVVVLQTDDHLDRVLAVLVVAEMAHWELLVQELLTQVVAVVEVPMAVAHLVLVVQVSLFCATLPHLQLLLVLV
jgi:hypothetical protein